MRRRSEIVFASVIAILALSACGSDDAETPGGAPPLPSTRPSTTAQLAILKPAPNEAVRGSSVELVVSLQGARVVPAASTNLRPDEGHIHVQLDGRLISMTEGLRQVISGLTPGAHSIRVEFVASDHAPFEPRLFASVTFEVVA